MSEPDDLPAAGRARLAQLVVELAAADAAGAAGGAPAAAVAGRELARFRPLAHARLLAAVQGALPAFVLQFDGDGGVRRSDPVLTGGTAAAASGTPPGFRLREPDAAALRGAVRQAAASGRAAHLRVVAADGQTYACAVVPLPDALGAAGGPAVAVATPESLPRELARLVATVEQLEAFRHLAAQDAHDFNNRLTVILGNLSLASDMLADGETAGLEELLAEATAATHAAKELSHQLQSLGHAIAAERQPQDVAALAAEVIAEQQDDRRRAELRGGASRPPPVEAAAGQLKLAIAHLLRNAWEASGDQPVQVVVQACVVVPGDPLGLAPGPAVELRVEDRGPGVPPAARDRLFQAGFTTKAGAAGVGLTIARTIVRQHHGVLELDATAPGGCFRLVLPALAAPAGGGAAAPPG